MPQFQPFQEWLVQLVSMTSNTLLGIAAVIGVLGIWQWRTELIGKTKFEVARQLMLLALQFRDEFHRARNIFTFAGESIERKKGDKETPAEGQVLDEYFARNKRLQLLQGTLRKMYEVNWEAEVVLSEGDAKLTQPFEESFRQLYIATEIYFREQLNSAKSERRTVLSFEKQDEMHKTIYGLSDDDIGKAVDEGVNTLKKRLRIYVR